MVDFKVPTTPFEQWTVKTAFDTDHDGQVRANLLRVVDHGRLALRAMRRKGSGVLYTGASPLMRRKPPYYDWLHLPVPAL